MDISEKRAKAGRNSAKMRKKATSVEQNPSNANKEKERKEKSMEDTNVSMSDDEHPTQERIDYKALINIF